MRTGMEWDPWYYELCTVVGKKSQCLSRKIGAILVRDKAVVSQGFNGPPRGVQTCDLRWVNDPTLLKEYNKKLIERGRSDRVVSKMTEDSSIFKRDFEGVCPRYVPEMGFKSGEGLNLCIAGHAERNALINAARFGIATKGTKIYMDCGIPCKDCLAEIINAGIEEIIVTKISYYDISSEYLLKQSGIKYRVYNHLKENN